MASDAEQGQLQPAPESFLSKDLVEDISGRASTRAVARYCKALS